MARAHAVQRRRPRRRQGRRPSPVAPAQRSPAALAKAATKTTLSGGPVHRFATLLDDLVVITANRIQPAGGLLAFTVIAPPGLEINKAWMTAALAAATLLAWLRLLALDGDLAKAEPKTVRYRILHAAARLGAADGAAA